MKKQLHQLLIGDNLLLSLIIINKTKEFKATHDTLTPEFKKEIQVWYNQNKGKCIASDLLKLIE